MNIQTSVDERLWATIQSSYGNRNFSGAILDSLYFISELIREKTGLLSDGTALAGQAFGGKSPKLRVNKLETESEKNLQAGLEQIIRGLYLALRNPRAHGKVIDKKEDADAIILFINYLIHIIDQSKTPFTKTEFLDRVFDSYFVENKRYSDLLASDVPKKYQLDFLLEVFRARETGDPKKLKFFVNSMLSLLTQEQMSELYSVVSEDLRKKETESIRTILQIFPVDALTYCDEDARLRTEHILLKSISEGAYVRNELRCRAGALGTWARGRIQTFLQKDELLTTMTKKLLSSKEESQAYLFNYFWDEFTKLMPIPSKHIILALKSQLKSGNKALYDKLWVEKEFGNPEWGKPFEPELDSFRERDPENESPSDDDIPF
jgi:uncharacterized protein (TIGR02391 family)